MEFRLLQINLHHCIEATTKLILYSDRFKADIVLIQEPWITSKGISGLNVGNYELFACAELKNNRTCILAKKYLKRLLLKQFTNRDQTVVELESNGRKAIFSSSYFAHSDESDPPPDITRCVAEYSKQNNIDLIISCDANAHHLLWGSTDTNDRGVSVMEFILEYGLLVANTGNEPTFETRRIKQVLDLTLVTQLNNLEINKWKVSKEDSFSDHKYIEFTINMISQEPPETFRNPRRIKWDTFLSKLSEDVQPLQREIMNTKDIEYISGNLESAFDVAFKASCPFSKINNKKNKEWWHKDLEKLRRSTTKALNLARKHNTDRKWELYKEKRKEFKKQIRKSKRQCFVDKMKDLETIKDTSRLRKLMSKQNYVASNVKKPNGEWAMSAKETLETLFMKHFPGCELNTENYQIPETHSETIQYALEDDLITMDKIKWAVRTFEPYKSPGIDGVYPIMLQNSIEIIGLILKRLFIACIQHSYVPTNWKKVKVVFIPKVGKIQHCEAKDYRPISLSSFLLKTLERILDNHIRERMGNILFSPDQHAYIKGKSVETALHSLTSRIEKSIYQGEYALACFLDIEGAFNNIKSEAIDAALNNSNCDQAIRIWIMKMLTQRNIQAELGGCVLDALATRGTPQGGVISPTLWILVLNEILVKLNNLGFGVVAYADDVVLIVRGKFPSILAELMEGALRMLHKWSTQCGLGINPTKTEMVLFTRKRKIPNFDTPKLDGKTLTLSEEATFLGIVFDNKLNWIPNLNERIKKAYAAIYSCQKLIGKTWGLKPRLIYWIYKAIVRPTIAYGSLVWWPIMDVTTHASLIERVNRVVALSISGAKKSTATEAMCRILDMDPLPLHIKEYALRTQVRLRQNGQLEIRGKGHSSLISNYHYEDIQTDYMTSHIIWDNEIIAIIPSRENWNATEHNPLAIDVYTDGSKKENGTGCGIYCEKLGIRSSCRLNDECSIFQAEIFAISEAAHLISMRPIFKSDITLFIDSQAAIKALCNRNIRSKVVSRCRRELQVLNEQHFLKLCWVPGHNNIYGNEMADELARAGADMDINSACKEVFPGLSSIYQNIRTIFRNEAENLWDKCTRCKQTKALWQTRDKSTQKRIINMEKHELRMYVGIITGHNNLRYFLKKIRIRNDDICRWCNEEEEDTFHFLCQCVALSNYRFKCFGSYFFQNLEDLRDMDPVNIVKYVKLSKLYENFPTQL